MGKFLIVKLVPRKVSYGQLIPKVLDCERISQHFVLIQVDPGNKLRNQSELLRVSTIGCLELVVELSI